MHMAYIFLESVFLYLFKHNKENEKPKDKSGEKKEEEKN